MFFKNSFFKKFLKIFYYILYINKINILKGQNELLNDIQNTQETQSATQAMKKLMEIKRLQIMQSTGQTLTPEQKQLLDEHIRQTNEAQVRFRKQQYQNKSKGLSL